MVKDLKTLLQTEAGGGIVLFCTAVLALVWANSPLSFAYEALLGMPVEVRVGPLQLAKPLLLWVNDGLMAIFFFLVGLELKREMLSGELSSLRSVVFPGLGALGGMLAPALIYVLINWGDELALSGWAIPAATDIAFALGVLALLGKRVPPALKLFLLSLAIFDDLGAIIIIALFYSGDLALGGLAVAVVCLVLLWVLNRRGVCEVAPYALLGFVMWVAVLKSGVHATLAGVALAFFIPLQSRDNPEVSPLRELEHDLHGAVSFGVLPVFALCNAGVSLAGVGLASLMHGVPLGIALGLLVGKQFGIMLFCGLGVMLGIASLPQGVTWKAVYGASLLCGVGFTMSLFIGSLAFEQSHVDILFDERLGILLGSSLSGLAGYLVLRKVLPASG
ncbi:MAG: Na+/H+ antiporter NhaA [Desulfuromonas sp.]|nr:MAG: Na+/H+ antiporter NhaA [Desulfuromonas sp.]